MARSKLPLFSVLKIFGGKVKPMNIVRYQRYPQRSLTVSFDRLTNMRDELNRAFETSFGSFIRPVELANRWNPAVDVYQDNDQFTVYAELPGLKKEEIEISLNGDTLTISGERKAEANADQGSRNERDFGKFQRSLYLPVAVNPEKVSASYKDGILKVLLPKAEEAKPKVIPVSLD
jgi:HSP20 family protein